MTTVPAPPKPRPERAACAYIRVSSVAQAAADKVSLSEQASAISTYCSKAGLELVATYSDVASGTSRRRPEWLRMLAAAEAGTFSHLVAWNADRLARGGGPMSDLLDAAPASKVTIHTANGTIFDRRYAELLASVARIERDSFSERAMVGRRGRAKAGRLPISKAPFGYLVGRSDDGKPTGLLETISKSEPQMH